MAAALTLACPAKLNLFLAVTGRRSDGFHDLVSLVSTVELGDELTVERADDGSFSLSCSDADLAVDESNLIMRAVRAFVACTGWRGGARMHLHKNIPVGAGLGGGSSDAVGTLRALNHLAGAPLDHEALLGLAAQLGSDCPLFLAGGPVVMRGRGEKLSPVAPQLAARLHGHRVLIFKPALAINTAWAYRRMAAAQPSGYLPGPQAEEALTTWCESEAPGWPQPVNSFEAVVGAKFIALPVLLRQLRETHRLPVALSGSGSACFALLPAATNTAALIHTIRQAWGNEAWIRETRLGVGNAD
jgi:4-diphosphocytidyl-2-C-methyl-D-erythritol kinase